MANIPAGTVHDKVPADMKKLINDPKIEAIWHDITPLARNEWICWVEDAKKPETRIKRLSAMIDKMNKGMRRPCCWAGCPHR